MKGKSNRRFNKFVSIGLITVLTASFCVGIIQSTLADNAIFSSFAAEASQNEIVFEFDKDESTLTLSGNIEMSDFTAQDCAPWGQYRASAEKIVIEDGIKSLGDNAFVSFSDLSEVTIPQSVTKISDNAFVDCSESFTIKGITDSEAYKFAQNKQYKFEELAAVSDSDAVPGDSAATTSSAPSSTTTTSSTAAATAPAPADPTVPANIKVTCAAYDKLKISWSKVDGAAGYYVYCSTSKNGKYTLAKNITRGTVTEFIHSNRVYEKTYYYKVRSYTKSGSKLIFAGYSKIVSGKTHINPPAVVQNVKVTCKSYNQLYVSWNKVNGAKGYYVYCSEALHGKYRVVKNITRNTTTAMLHSGRNTGKTYYYKVVSYTKAGYKTIYAASSAVASGKTYLKTPAAPRVTAKYDGNIYITFTRVTGAYKYNLYRSVDGGKFTRIAVITSKYTDKNTIPGKKYSYKLAAVRGSFVTEGSPAASAVCSIAAPAISSAVSKNYSSVTVKWKKVSNATQYKIYRSTEKNSGYTCIGTVNARTYAFTASGLQTGTTYYFRVAAGKTLGGKTGYSNMSSIRAAVPSLTSVQKVWGSSVGSSAIFVEWSKVTGASGYELYSANPGKAMVLLEDGNKYYYSHKNLTAGNKYYYRVRAYRLVNNRKVYSSYSKTIAVTIPKTLSKSTYSWSYSNNVVNHKTPADLIKAQEKANNIKTLFVGDTTRKVIYLTMDCGYPTSNSNKNLDTLKKKNVKATFFIALPYAQGSHAQIRRMIDEGHIVGNHTKSHIRLNKASSSVIQSQVKTLENYIYNNFNYRTKYFRYPYGSFSQASQNELIKMGYTSAGWSFAYNDYSSRQPKPEQALNLIVKNIHPGAIFLLHMDSNTNTAILGDFIDKARAMGYEFETLDDIEI